MKILHISAECYPIAKVGGLADVVGSLPKYQNNKNTTAQVCMPFYDNEFTKKNSFSTVYSSILQLGGAIYDYRILTTKSQKLGFDLFLVDIPKLLFKDYVYSYDDSERFLAFQIAVLDWLLTLGDLPTTIHVHDHHVGLLPFMITQCFKYKKLKSIPTVLTIHNAQYQGWFSHDKVGLIPEFDFKNIGFLDWGDCINPLATAIKCAWRVTTVSPSYMEELKIEANGLEYLLRHESAKCVGILNGIDISVWNTETDNYLTKNYKTTSVLSGKKANKEQLCKEFNLDLEKPLFAFIGRLVGEKGADLFPDLFARVLDKKEASILLLGSGHKNIESDLEALKDKYEGSYNAYIGYDEKLSHLIYAGADFLLMPSRVEPCGLNQMYALRYGTIPVVRNIGGLKDTVIDISEKNGFGISFNEAQISDIDKAVDRGINLYKNQKEYKKIRNKIMQIDHSWDASAIAYINLYKSLKS